MTSKFEVKRQNLKSNVKIWSQTSKFEVKRQILTLDVKKAIAQELAILQLKLGIDSFLSVMGILNEKVHHIMTIMLYMTI